jgi:putative spermidine/putrescine transport system ATP-binding protein
LSDPRLRLASLSHNFGRVRALDALSFDVMPGEYVTLLGPSGSGKSTTLALIAGFLEQDAGTIELDSRPLRHTPPHRRNIGLVFQAPQLLPHLTVAGNIALPLTMRRVGRADRDSAVSRMLGLVALSGMAERMPASLSGGQAQRVALARALVFNPKLVLLDEPLGALDRQLREAMQQELRGVQQRLGVSMLHVTHDQTEAMAVSDRMAVIDAGRLRQIGTPRELYERPADGFVAAFLGEDNRLPGRVESIEDEIAHVRLEGGTLVEALDAGVVPGGACFVAIRPERLAVAHGDMGDDAVPGILRETSFRGDHLRLLVDVAGTRVVVKRPTVVPMATLAPGSALSLAWQPHHARALPVYVG